MVLKGLPKHFLRFLKRCRNLKENLWNEIYQNLQSQLDCLSQEPFVAWETFQALLEKERYLIKELILNYENLKTTRNDLIKTSLLSLRDWQEFHIQNLSYQKLYLDKKKSILKRLKLLKSQCQQEKKSLITQRFLRVCEQTYTKTSILDIIS